MSKTCLLTTRSRESVCVSGRGRWGVENVLKSYFWTQLIQRGFKLWLWEFIKSWRTIECFFHFIFSVSSPLLFSRSPILLGLPCSQDRWDMSINNISNNKSKMWIESPNYEYECFHPPWFLFSKRKVTWSQLYNKFSTFALSFFHNLTDGVFQSRCSPLKLTLKPSKEVCILAIIKPLNIHMSIYLIINQLTNISYYPVSQTCFIVEFTWALTLCTESPVPLQKLRNMYV